MKQRLVVAYGGGEGAQLAFFASEHPRTRERVMFGCNGAHLLEVHTHSSIELPSSWLISGLECVVQDGTLCFATPIDPLFVLLPLLERARGVATAEHRGLFKPLPDVFGREEALLEAHLMSLPGLSEKLTAICDVNDKYDELMVRLSDAKVIAWLRRKVQALSPHINALPPTKRGLPTTPGPAVGALSQFESAEGHFHTIEIEQNKAQASTRSCYLLVCEYVSDKWAERLREELGVKDNDFEDKNRSVNHLEATPVYKSTPPQLQADLPPRSTNPAPAKKAKLLEPLRKGQRSMESFFAKKA